MTSQGYYLASRVSGGKDDPCKVVVVLSGTVQVQRHRRWFPQAVQHLYEALVAISPCRPVMLLYQAGLMARAKSPSRQEVCPVAVTVGDEAGQADEGPHPAATPHPDNLPNRVILNCAGLTCSMLSAPSFGVPTWVKVGAAFRFSVEARVRRTNYNKHRS